MNKWFVGLASMLMIGGVVYAQGFGRPDAVPGQVPGVQPPVRPGLGMMSQVGRSGTSIAASDRYVYVLRGDTLMQLSVDGLKVVGQTKLPSVASDTRGGEGGGRRNRDAQPPTVD